MYNMAKFDRKDSRPFRIGRNKLVPRRKGRVVVAGFS